MDFKKKDNLTDLTTHISNQPKNQGENAVQPSNLADNQVIGVGGEIIDLGFKPDKTKPVSKKTYKVVLKKPKTYKVTIKRQK